MRKHFLPIIMLTLIFIGTLTNGASASDIQWQIRWMDNGTLQEQVRVLEPDIIPEDSSWQRSKEGDQFVLRREVKNWSSYQELQYRLPLQVKQKNYIVFKQVEVGIDNGQSKELFQQLKGSKSLDLTLYVPGIIIGNSADNADESNATWAFSDSAELLQETSLLKVITVDGLILGIEILVAGLLIILIKFFRRLKKVDQIIEEEYSLTKINPSDQKEGEQQ